MAKKGVFGLKSTPISPAQPSDMPMSPKEINITEAKSGGFMVRIHGGTGMGETHVAADLEAVDAMVSKHFGVSEKE